MLSSYELRLKRKKRQRLKLSRVIGSRPRLCVHRTARNIYAQIIDDSSACILISASSLSLEASASIKNGGNKNAAVFVGSLIAKKAKERGIESVVFDRSGFLYHGRIKSFADSVREGGLKF